MRNPRHLRIHWLVKLFPAQAGLLRCSSRYHQYSQQEGFSHFRMYLDMERQNSQELAHFPRQNPISPAFRTLSVSFPGFSHLRGGRNPSAAGFRIEAGQKRTFMLIKKSSDIPSSEITPKPAYLSRRKFIAGAVAAGAALAGGFYLRDHMDSAATVHAGGMKLSGIVKSPFSTSETPNSFKDITNYNNYYEFSTDKYEPNGMSKDFRTRPWTVAIDGLVKKPKKLDIDAILKLAPLEERIYRHRCVEGWSMVIPWVGFPLSALIKQAEPLGSAKFVAFETVLDPNQMPNQKRSGVLDWAYVEGLR